ncbi:MAG TPA: glycine cleavage system protein GcvH [Rhodothermales bacterium]
MRFPDDVRYTSDHEWIRVESDNKTAVIGITDFAQHELGDIVFVELEPVGSEIAKEATFGTVEAVKTVSELFMPVSGRIEAHNEDLDANPEKVNQDPYGAGWMIRITLSDPSELDSLMDAESYRDLVAEH